MNYLFSNYIAEMEERLEAPRSGAVIICLISMIVAAYLGALSFAVWPL